MKILKVFAGVVFIFHFTMANAQMCPCEFGGTEKALRNEIGINGFNINEVLINFYSAKQGFQKNYANGLMFRHHFNKFSLRLGLDYMQNNYQYQRGTANSNDYNLNTGKSYSKDIRLGIEKSLANGKLQPYVAADLIGSLGRYSGTTEGHGDLLPVYKEDYSFHTSAFGVSPAVGLRYRPFKHFSISAEASLSVIHYSTNRNSGAYAKESGMDILVNPLRLLSLNYHF